MVLDATSGPAPTLHGTPGADAAAVAAAAGGEPPGLGEGFGGLVVGHGAGSRGAGEDPGESSVDAGNDEAVGEGRGAAAALDPAALDRRIVGHALLQDCLLVVQVEGAGREVVEKLVQAPLGPVRIAAVVSPDVPLDDRDLLLWGIFTRFDCARDVVFTSVRHRGPWTTCHGVLGIDATFKRGYPAPLEMSPDVVASVDRRWSEYGID
jgi:hypothetical protein